MLSHIFRQSNLDRIHSIMALWVLTLTLSLGILVSEEFGLRASQQLVASRGIRHLPVVPNHFGNTVFVQRSARNWIDSSFDQASSAQPLKSNSMTQPSPFERPTEPHFCEFKQPQQAFDLSIKLTIKQTPALRVADGRFVFGYVRYLR